MAGAGIGSSRGSAGRFASKGSRELSPWGKVLEDERVKRGWSQEKTVGEAGIKSTSVWTTTIYGSVRDRKTRAYRKVLPLAETLANLALALGLDSREVLELAGYTAEPITYHLENVPTDQLVGELWRRDPEAWRLVRAPKAGSSRSASDTPSKEDH